MLKLYNYLFYRSYDLVKLTGNYDLAWGASHFLALFLGILNTKIISSIGVFDKFEPKAFVSLSVYFGIHILNYFLFLKEDKYKKIISYYSPESTRSKIIGRFLIIVLIIYLLYSLF